MLSLYHAYECYERRVARGEFDNVRSAPQKAIRVARPSLSFRLGDLLIRTGMRLKHQTQAGHALTAAARAGN
jgi:hypothetical protein